MVPGPTVCAARARVKHDAWITLADALIVDTHRDGEIGREWLLGGLVGDELELEDVEDQYIFSFMGLGKH